MTAMLGLIATSLIIVTNIATVCLLILGKPIKDWASSVALLSPILTICIYTVLFYIICNVSKQIDFRIVMSIIIVLQVLLLLIVWFEKFKILPSQQFYIMSIMIAGLALLGLYLWFFIMLSNTHESEIKAIKYLKLFAITYLILVVINFVVSLSVAILKHESIGNDKLILISYQLLDIIPYAFLTFFFFKHLDETGKD